MKKIILKVSGSTENLSTIIKKTEFGSPNEKVLENIKRLARKLNELPKDFIKNGTPELSKSEIDDLMSYVPVAKDCSIKQIESVKLYEINPVNYKED